MVDESFPLVPRSPPPLEKRSEVCFLDTPQWSPRPVKSWVSGVLIVAFFLHLEPEPFGSAESPTEDARLFGQNWYFFNFYNVVEAVCFL